MSDDLVKRLRDWEHVWPEDMDKPAGHLYDQAADRIEELEKRNASLEAKLAKVVDALEAITFECVGDEARCGARTTLAELTGERQKALQTEKAKENPCN